jgi:hypothetical protein
VVGIATKHITHSRTGFHINEVTDRPPAIYDEAVWDLSRYDDPVGGIDARKLDASVDNALLKTFDFMTMRFLSEVFVI